MKAELIHHFGDDNMIVDVARVSYAKKAANYTDEQNGKLIKYLVNHKHTSPFRHPSLQFRIECPIYVERQLFKHQIGLNANSISGRYVDFSDSYYEITEWRMQSESSKQGSAGAVSESVNKEACAIQHEIIEICQLAYEKMVKLGISKEQARTILPLNLNTQFVWTGSMLAFTHLFNLRLKPDAQQETRELVQQMLEQVQSIPGNPFALSLQAFGY
jgi:thymidylate synthase (FAD)